MEKKEFSGPLDDIDPRLLIDSKESKEFQNFFLILALIFNDLKGLLFFRKFLEEHYRHPNPGEVTVHAGEYGGLVNQNNKLLIATLSEFIIFLNKNTKVTKSQKFILLLQRLPQKSEIAWSELLRQDTGFISKIARIRSNIAFHYDNYGEELRSGFIRSFYGEGKDMVQHQRAHFTLGDSLTSTRFFYSDAAVEDYVKSVITVEEWENIAANISNMNIAIRFLIVEYFKSLGKNIR